MTRPKNMKEINLGMSNFDDGTPDEGFEDTLRKNPGTVYGNHHGWRFCGDVWFQNGLFHEEVYVHHLAREIISAESLLELHKKVCDIYGYD